VTDPQLQTFEEFKRSFEKLKLGWGNRRQKVISYSKTNACDFNIFQALGVKRRELSHSALLAELFNPNGSHGQGEVFLKSFLQEICQKPGCSHIPVKDYIWDNWSIGVERNITTSDRGIFLVGRMDIVLEYRGPDPANSVLIVIENKIDAEEQHKQLKKYSDWIDSQKQDFDNRALIYLTVKGNKSKSEGVTYTRMSYTEDISKIIVKSCKLIPSTPTRVCTVLEQYYEVVKSLDRRHRLQTRSEKELTAYLTQPENLEVALDIANHIVAVKTELLERFWEKIEEYLRERLYEASLEKTWQLRDRKSGDRDLEVVDNWYGLDICDKSVKADAPSYRYTVSQQTRPAPPILHFAVYKYGATEAFSVFEEDPQYERFSRQLEKGHPHSPMGQYVRFDSRKEARNDVEWFVKLSKDEWNRFAEDIAHTAWDNFSQVRESMHQANRMISKGS